MAIFYVCPNHLEESLLGERPLEEHDRCPECGGKLVIPYIYDICPHCMDELIERNLPLEDLDSDKFCPKCGKKLNAALLGAQKLDDTTYKIILKDASITEYGNRRNRFIEELMKMGNISFDEALEKYNTKDSLIFKGNAREVYIKMDLIDGFSDQLHYQVVPNFPFLRFATPFSCICPTCGSDTIPKEGGIFCEKCNEWVLYPPL